MNTFGGSVQADVIIGLTCWAATWLTARNGAEAMRVALDAYQGGDIAVASVTMERIITTRKRICSAARWSCPGQL